jgi:ABC-2 type transport system permease protein
MNLSLALLRKYGRVVWAAAEMNFRQAATDAFILFAVLVQPLIIAIVGLWMLSERGGDYAIFVVVGSGLTGLWSSLLFISGNSITSERWSGTLELMVGIPTPLQVIVFGKNLSNVIQSLASMVIAYALISLLFGYPLAVQQPALFFVSLIFLIMSFVCFGLMLAPFFVVNPAVQQWQNGLEFPVYILCGFLFPIALLPGWTTPLSYVLAPYWAARALHGASSGGAGLNEIVFCWAMMLGLSLLYLVVSGWLFKAVLKKARTDATLRMQ